MHEAQVLSLQNISNFGNFEMYGLTTDKKVHLHLSSLVRHISHCFFFFVDWWLCYLSKCDNRLPLSFGSNMAWFDGCKPAPVGRLVETITPCFSSINHFGCLLTSGLQKTSYCNTAKSAVNTWLSNLVAAAYNQYEGGNATTLWLSQRGGGMSCTTGVGKKLLKI